MTENKINFISFIENIDPSNTSYEEWCQVGMGLKHEGYDWTVWDEWSSSDSQRYKKSECFKKWNSFQQSGVTGGTIVEIAKRYGWRPKSERVEDRGQALDWDSVISDELKVIDTNWIEGKEVVQPQFIDSVTEITKYISALFESSDYVGVVTTTYEQVDQETGEVEYKPTKGVYSKTAGQILEELAKCNGDIGAVFGDYRKEAGAWIRFNPLDGKGVANSNVTDYRYALVESDSMDIDKQNAIYRELELPIAMLVHSGNKSLHAIVKVDATSYEEYRSRVDFLYTVCRKNGLDVDQQNRNPSRLSRMPGVQRGENKQFIVDSNIGKSSWNDWKEYIESVNDELPDPEGLESMWDNLPPLAPELIQGMLRQGHKMLVSGPSKAGKSFALIELCIAIAEGKNWIGLPCTKGKVLYVNLELDRASCFHRFKDVYTAIELAPNNINNIDIWNLRGMSTPLDSLAPKLIRRALKKNYIAIVIDPIYKVITGDENSASEMAKFTNQFDKICTELKTAVIYCHHHSKGAQGGKKAMDRASGSGVFARDPDAILDLIELEIPGEMKSSMKNEAQAKVMLEYLKYCNETYYKENVSTDDAKSAAKMSNHIESGCTKEQIEAMQPYLFQVDKDINSKSAWRIDATLREFPKLNEINIWFNYPRHIVDTEGKLKDLSPEDAKAPWEKAAKARKPKEQNKKERLSKIETAFQALEIEGREVITIQDLMDEMEVSDRTVWRRIKEHGGFESINQGKGLPSIIRRKEENFEEVEMTNEEQMMMEE